MIRILIAIDDPSRRERVVSALNQSEDLHLVSNAPTRSGMEPAISFPIDVVVTDAIKVQEDDFEDLQTEGCPLSIREAEVLICIAMGVHTKGIAYDLEISPKTVETHRRRITQKLGIDDTAGLTRYAIRQGMIEP